MIMSVMTEDGRKRRQGGGEGVRIGGGGGDRASTRDVIAPLYKAFCKALKQALRHGALCHN